MSPVAPDDASPPATYVTVNGRPYRVGAWHRLAGHLGHERLMLVPVGDASPVQCLLGGSMGAITDMTPERLLTPGEVAALFRVDPKTVTRWAKQGRLPWLRTLGGHRRFRWSDFEPHLLAVL